MNKNTSAPRANEATETHTEESQAPAPWYTVAAVAKVLNLDPMTVRRMIYRGEIPAYRFGRVLRIPVSALDPANLTPVVGS